MHVRAERELDTSFLESLPDIEMKLMANLKGTGLLFDAADR